MKALLNLILALIYDVKFLANTDWWYDFITWQQLLLVCVNDVWNSPHKLLHPKLNHYKNMRTQHCVIKTAWIKTAPYPMVSFLEVEAKKWPTDPFSLIFTLRAMNLKRKTYMQIMEYTETKQKFQQRRKYVITTYKQPTWVGSLVKYVLTWMKNYFH